LLFIPDKTGQLTEGFIIKDKIIEGWIQGLWNVPVTVLQ
jgi:hypothetical protein